MNLNQPSAWKQLKSTFVFYGLFQTIQMKSIVQYSTMLLVITLYKVVQTFESMDEIFKCDHSNEEQHFRIIVVLFIIIIIIIFFFNF